MAALLINSKADATSVAHGLTIGAILTALGQNIGTAWKPVLESVKAARCNDLQDLAIPCRVLCIDRRYHVTVETGVSRAPRIANGLCVG